MMPRRPFRARRAAGLQQDWVIVIAQTDSTNWLIAEPYTTAVLLSILGVLAAFSVLFSRTVDRMGIPIVLLFLVLGMVGGSEGIGGVPFDDYHLAVRLGTIALVLILFDGGINTAVGAIRQVLWPAVLLATMGVAATAGLMALCARMLGLGWNEALLLGAVVSSTDAAAVFAVLRGGSLHLKQRVARTIEVESCINDPMAVILTMTMIDMIATGDKVGWSLLVDVPMQLAIGSVVGLILGYMGVWLLRRVRLTTVGLYPALTLSLAFLSFGMATLAGGSGFLAVFVTGVMLGNSALPFKSGLVRIHDAIAWLSQLSMFLMLGLLVYPSRLLDLVTVGVGVALFLAFVARPLAVAPFLFAFRYPWKENLLVSWTGIRASVPIVLATFPVLAEVPAGEQVFNLVFFIVVVSAIIPGSTLRWVSRKLDLIAPEEPAPSAVLEINSPAKLEGELVSYFISPALAVNGAKLREIDFPPGSNVLLIIRGNQLLAARGDTVLETGDHVYVYFREEDRPFIELLFGRPEEA